MTTIQFLAEQELIVFTQGKPALTAKGKQHFKANKEAREELVALLMSEMFTRQGGSSDATR